MTKKYYYNFGILPPIAMESIFRETLFFVVVKKRPTEAVFSANKKSVWKKILEWKAGKGTKKLTVFSRSW